MPKDVKKHYYNWFNEKETKRFLKNTIYKNLNDLKNYTEIEISKKDVVFFGIFTKSNFHIGNIKLYNIKKRIDKCELNDEVYTIVDDFDLEKELYWNEFRTKAEDEVNSWDWYDKKLFTLYRDNKTSIRKLAKETGISFVSIFHTLKANKQKLKRLLQDDYDNLKL